MPSDLTPSSMRRKTETRRVFLAAFGAAVVVCSSCSAAPRYADDGYSIIRPEPGTAQRQKPRPGKMRPSPSRAATIDDEAPPKRKTTVYPYRPPPRIDPREGIVTPRIAPSVGQTFSEPPPPVVIPGTGRTIQNLPSAGGRETTQDRSLRCTHQAGLNSVPGEQRGAYISSCIGQ